MNGENLRTRIEMFRQLLSTYDRQPTEDSLKGYLTVTNGVPLGSLQRAITAAMGNSGSFPPGPGDVLTAWRWEARHGLSEPAKAPEPREQIGSGPAQAELPATVGGFRLSVRMQQVTARAEEIRAEGRLVPKDWTSGRLLAHLRAADELGVDWPLDPKDRENLDEAMRRHEAAGGEVAWWWKRTGSSS